MITWNYEIRDPEGLHARPASKLVMAAREFQSSISLICGQCSADAKNIMDVMALGANRGAVIIVRIQGADEIEASEAIKKTLVDNDDLNPRDGSK